MTAPDAPHREELMAKLAESRAEISRLLETPGDSGSGEAGDGPDDLHEGFPRSRTMRALMSGRGIGAIGAMAGGLLLARPRFAWTLLRMLPTGAVARMVMGRVVGAMRGRR